MVSKSMYGLQVGKDQRNENYLNPLDEGVKKNLLMMIISIDMRCREA